MIYQPNAHHSHTFCAVVNAGSFAKAAEHLFISQPAISAQIKELQERLGMPLFDRVGRRSVVNETGRMVYKYGMRLFQMTEELTTASEEYQWGMAGRLRLGVSPAWQHFLARALGEFKREYPHVHPSLEVAGSGRIVELVLAHVLDIGFVGEAISSRDLVVQEVAKDELSLFVASDHWFMGLPHIPTKALSHETFVMREPGSAVRRIGERCLLQLGVSPASIVEMGSDEAVKQAVMTGLGLGITPRNSVEVELGARRLRIVGIPGFRCAITLYSIHHRHKRLTAAQRAFIEQTRGAENPAEATGES